MAPDWKTFNGTNLQCSILLLGLKFNKNSLDDVLVPHVEARERADAFLAMNSRGRAHEQTAVSAAGPTQLVALGIDEGRRWSGAALLVEMEAVVLRRFPLLSSRRRGLYDEIPIRQVRNHVNSLLFHLWKW